MISLHSNHLTLLLTLLWSSAVYAQAPIEYTLNLDQIHHHELGVTITFDGVASDTLEIRMPEASPGRYAVHHFTKNLYNEQATDLQGNNVNLIRTSQSSWKIPVTSNAVKFSYTLYGNHADGTYAGFDATKVHMNMPATFAYGVGLDDREIALNIDLADHANWTIATQLVQESENRFTAPNYYYFYDSPTMVGDIKRRSWQVGDQTIEVAMQHLGTDDELDAYTEWIKKIVAAEQNVFGELPRFDYGRYTFLISYTPWVEGDAMEHRNSTVCTSKGNLSLHAPLLIGSIAHEFFHAWNIERIRPKSLEPFDFDHANLSGELWFGEGFTNYYDELAQCRAGVVSKEKFLHTATKTLNAVINSPARSYRTPIQMSHNASFVDAATSIDETNYLNNFISYYTYGEFLGLALDLSIRSEFQKLTLDNYMRAMWIKYGKTEIPYTLNDLQTTLAEVTGSTRFANKFFEEYIYQSKIPDMPKLFDHVGIEMIEAKPHLIYLGSVSVDAQGVLSGKIQKGTALYEAGLDIGDQIISINELTISEETSFDMLIKQLTLNKSYPIVYNQMGTIKSAMLTTTPSPEIELKFAEKMKEKTNTARLHWLGQ